MKEPAKSDVARWWALEAFADVKAHPRLWIDLGEPSCQACRYWSESWDKGKPSASLWDKASGIALWHTGGDRIASNYLLLCGRCLDAAPKSGGREAALAWAAAKIDWLGEKIGPMLAVMSPRSKADAADRAIDAVRSLGRVEALDALTEAMLAIDLATRPIDRGDTGADATWVQGDAEVPF